MIKLSVLIVEDEVLIAETIKSYLEERGHQVVAIAISYEEAVHSIRFHDIDVALVDIRLYGERSGIQVAEYIAESEKDIPVIYLTSQYDRRIVQHAMDTNPHGYLIKPIQKQTLWTTLELAAHNFKLSKIGEDAKILLQDGYDTYRVSQNEIEFVKSDAAYLSIHLTDNRRLYIRESLKTFLESVNQDLFIQCHRSFIVNIEAVTSYSNNELKIGRTEIPISRSRKEQVLTRIAGYSN